MNFQQLAGKFVTDYQSDTLTRGHIAGLLLHVATGLSFVVAYHFELTDRILLLHWAWMYFMAVPVILLISFYEELRNYKVFFLWLLAGAIQLAPYFFTANNSHYNQDPGSNVLPLKALFVMLVSLQFFRQLYMLFFPGELITPYWRSSWYDDNDGRKISWPDILFSMIIFVLTLLACFF